MSQSRRELLRQTKQAQEEAVGKTALWSRRQRNPVVQPAEVSVLRRRADALCVTRGRSCLLNANQTRRSNRCTGRSTSRLVLCAQRIGFNRNPPSEPPRPQHFDVLPERSLPAPARQCVPVRISTGDPSIETAE